MAGRGISIDILANVRDALKGTGDVEKALADIESTLEDMARNGDQSVDKMSRGFRDLARDADTSADKVERSYKDAYRDTARAADAAADDVVRSQRRMGDTSQEVGQEVRQNLGEGIANAARGDFESLADTIGDTFGGAVAGIGGIGAAGVAAAGALGLGAIVATISTIAAESEALKEAVKENFREMAEEGVAAWESTQSQMKRLTDAYADHEGEIQKIAGLIGLDFDVVAAAWAGNEDAIFKVQTAYGQMASELQNTFGVTREGAAATVDGWEKIMGPLNNVLKGYDGAKEKARALEEQQSEMWRKAIEDAGTATEQVDKFGNRLYTLPDGEQVVIDADTGKATKDLDTFKGDVDEATKDSVATIKLFADTGPIERSIAALRRRSVLIPIRGVDSHGRRID